MTCFCETLINEADECVQFSQFVSNKLVYQTNKPTDTSYIFIYYMYMVVLQYHYRAIIKLYLVYNMSLTYLCKIQKH